MAGEKLFTWRDAMKLFAFIIGGAGTGGALITTAPTNAAVDIKVERITERVLSNEKSLVTLISTTKTNADRLNDYISAHQREEGLKDQIMATELGHIREELERAREDRKRLMELLDRLSR